MRESEESLLVLDANILIKDFWLKAYSFNYLCYRHFLMHTVVIPELSLKESKAEIIRRAEDLLERMENNPESIRLLESYQKLFNKKRISKETPEKLGKRYEEFIIETLRKINGKLINDIEVKTSILVDRSINRVKPFNKGDKGMRDTILWLDILELAKDYRQISFVSENINDFADKEKLNLHPELVSEVSNFLPENYELLFFRNLDAFIAQMDKNRENGAEAFIRALTRGGYKNFVLDDWISENLISHLNKLYFDFDGVEWAGMPYWAESPKILRITKLVGLESYKPKFIDDNTIEFYVNVALIGDFEVKILISDPEEVIYYKQVKKITVNDNFWTTAIIESIATFVLKLTFNIKSQEIVDFQGVTLNHDWQSAIETIEEIIEETNLLDRFNKNE